MASTPETAESIRISADSHVTEPLDLWEKGLPAKFRDRALTFPNLRYGSGNYSRAGGRDPKAALEDMAADGMSAAVLFPTRGTDIYRQFYDKPADVDLVKAEERVYNDWLIEYCSEAPDRLWGLGFISLWDIDHAIKEMERVKQAGLKGVCVWIAPPAGLSWTTDHYERFWSACEDLNAPIGMHINYGFGDYVARGDGSDRVGNFVRRAYGQKAVAMQALTALIVSGVFERHPGLKVHLAEFESGWIPFFLEDLDVKIESSLDKGFREDLGLRLLPSEYFSRSVVATFMQDGVTSYLLGRWGADNFCFSNDYPHMGGIWPHSDDVIAMTLSELPDATRRKVLGENIAKFYDQPLPTPMPRTGQAVSPRDWVRPWLKSPDRFTFDKPKMGLAV